MKIKQYLLYLLFLFIGMGITIIVIQPAIEFAAENKYAPKPQIIRQDSALITEQPQIPITDSSGHVIEK